MIRRTISAVLALGLIAGGLGFIYIHHGFALRIGAMGIFMVAVGTAWLYAELKGD